MARQRQLFERHFVESSSPGGGSTVRHAENRMASDIPRHADPDTPFDLRFQTDRRNKPDSAGQPMAIDKPALATPLQPTTSPPPPLIRQPAGSDSALKAPPEQSVADDKRPLGKWSTSSPQNPLLDRIEPDLISDPARLGDNISSQSIKTERDLDQGNNINNIIKELHVEGYCLRLKMLQHLFNIQHSPLSFLYPFFFWFFSSILFSLFLLS